MNVIPGLIDTCQAVSEKAIEPRVAVTAAWERAKALQPVLKAFAYLPETPPEPGEGPLAGVAVGVKDLVDTADMPATYGSLIYAKHRPEADAAVVTRLRQLGATVLGKTVTTEFAWQHPGPTTNPWNAAHTPGGSSSGSAAAVGAGIVPLALGTQTLGSVIRPAAFCGVVGLKPTFGTLPRTGVHPLSGSLDHVGLFVRSVDDAALALGLLAPDEGLVSAIAAARPDGALRSLATLQLVAPPLRDPAIQPAQRAVFEAALSALRAGGVTVEETPLPGRLEGSFAVLETLLAYEAAQGFGRLMQERRDAFSPAMQALVGRGSTLSEPAYREALAQQAALRAEFAEWIAGHDGLLTIPALGEAPLGLGSTGDGRFCASWSLLGVPAITLPAGKGPAGLPLGLQLVGAWGGDAKLLQVARTCSGLLPTFEGLAA